MDAHLFSRELAGDLPGAFNEVMVKEPSTSRSLLDRLRAETPDQGAWRQFVECYTPVIYGWCRNRGLQEADARDVTQTVLVILARRMKTFTYDPSGRFRAWLHTVTRNAWSAFIEERAGSPRTGQSDALGSAEAREELVQRLDQRFDLELMELALAAVRGRVDEKTWEAFRLTAVEQMAAAEVAARLGMKVATVYVARSRVQQMARAEVERLEEKAGKEPA
jgi:RNA polymerase sigma-70 factor (ECF subfamily)